MALAYQRKANLDFLQPAFIPHSCHDFQDAFVLRSQTLKIRSLKSKFAVWKYRNRSLKSPPIHYNAIFYQVLPVDLWRLHHNDAHPRAPSAALELNVKILKGQSNNTSSMLCALTGYRGHADICSIGTCSQNKCYHLKCSSLSCDKQESSAVWVWCKVTPISHAQHTTLYSCAIGAHTAAALQFLKMTRVHAIHRVQSVIPQDSTCLFSYIVFSHCLCSPMWPDPILCGTGSGCMRLAQLLAMLLWPTLELCLKFVALCYASRLFD